MFTVYSILVEIQFIRAIPQFLFKLYNEFQTSHTNSFHCYTIIPHCNQQVLPVDSLNLIYVDLSQNRIPSSWMVEHMYITFLSKHVEEFGHPHIHDWFLKSSVSSKIHLFCWFSLQFDKVKPTIHFGVKLICQLSTFLWVLPCFSIVNTAQFPIIAWLNLNCIAWTSEYHWLQQGYSNRFSPLIG